MKVVNLKQAILQAWKERWSDYQWAINIKKNFPKGASWDYPNLAGMQILCKYSIVNLIWWNIDMHSIGNWKSEKY